MARKPYKLQYKIIICSSRPERKWPRKDPEMDPWTEPEIVKNWIQKVNRKRAWKIQMLDQFSPQIGPWNHPRWSPKTEPKKGALGPNCKAASWRRSNGPITPPDRHLCAYDTEKLVSQTCKKSKGVVGHIYIMISLKFSKRCLLITRQPKAKDLRHHFI